MSQPLDLNLHKPCVLVFRKRILPYSETFIAAQGNHLQNWKPVFVGATTEHSGAGLLHGADTCVLGQHVTRWRRALAVTAFKRFGSIPRSWLEALRKHQPALIHVHFGPDALAMGLPLAKALGIPLVVTFHGFDIMIDTPQSRYQMNRHKLFQQASRVIAVSDYIREQLIRHGCPKAKIIRHYIGIDLGSFEPIIGDFQRKDIVFVGRLTEKKGCCYLIEAVIRLAAIGCNPHLHIIGDGRLREELEQLARPLGDQVTFHGSQAPPVVREMVGHAAVFCAPSVTGRNGDAEGLGMVNLEAMALGTPVVSTFHTAIPEAVLNERTGILVPEADPEALAWALRRCLEDRDLSIQFAKNGIAHVRQNFDIRKQCKQLETIYEAVVADNP